MPAPSETQSLYLVIDQGGHSSRALVFDHDGRIVVRSQIPVSLNHPAPDRAEYAAGELPGSVDRAIAEVTAALGGRVNRLVSAGLAVQRAAVVCWDRESGRALCPVLSWLDRRGEEYLQGLGVDAAGIGERTGLRLSPHYGAGKLRWCLDHNPAIAEAAAAGRLACGPLASYLTCHLCREKPCLVEPGLACRTLLADYRRQAWDRELLDAFGLRAEWLPRIVRSDHGFGHIRLGDRDLPLRLVLGDQAASLFAAGAPDSGRLYVNAGSGAFVQCVFAAPPPARGRLLAGPAAMLEDTGFYSLEGTVNGAANALDWFDVRSDSRIDWEGLCPDRGETPVMFLNGIGGLGSPWWQPRFESRFVGEGDEAARARAVMESILFLIHTNIQQLSHLASGCHEILLGGGLSRFDGVCQSLADLTGLPLRRLDEPEHTALGVFSLLRGRAAPCRVQSFTPRADNPIRTRYRHWLEQMPPIPDDSAG